MKHTHQELNQCIKSANKFYSNIHQNIERFNITKKLAQTLACMKDTMEELNKLSGEIEIEISTESKIKAEDEEELTPLSCDPRGKITIESQNKDSQIHLLSDEKLGRGPYRQYSFELKAKVVELHKEGTSFSKISKILDIPSKNIVRWCRNGIERKFGAGRKVMDRNMEENLHKWICRQYEEGSEIYKEVIRNKAKEFSNNKQFNASIGWLKNFKKRYSLSEKFEIV